MRAEVEYSAVVSVGVDLESGEVESVAVRSVRGEDEMAAVLRFIGAIKCGAAGGTLVGCDRLAIFGKGRPEDVEHSADRHIMHADVDEIAFARLLAAQ